MNDSEIKSGRIRQVIPLSEATCADWEHFEGYGVF